MSELSKHLENNRADRFAQEQEKKESIRKLQNEFATLDFDKIRSKSDSELAAWQAEFPTDSPQFIFALQVWNNRTILEQTKWMKRSIYVGFLGIIIGAILTAFITWLLPPQKTDNHITPQNQATKNTTNQNTEKKNTDTKAPVGIKK